MLHPAPNAPSDDTVRLRAVWEVASDAMALSDPDGFVLDANPAYFRLYGYTPDEVLGRSFAVIFPEEMRSWAEEQYRATFARDEVAPAVQSTVRRNDGTERHVEVRYAFLTDAAGRRTALLSVIRDVTERTLAERQQAAFLAMVGHELKNPLTVIRGMAQLLQRGGDRRERAVASIVEQSKHLTRLVSDLLDLAQLEAGQLAVERTEVDLAALMARATEEVRLLAPAHPLLIELPDGPVAVRGDAGRLRQVLDNLLANATKYSPAGSAVRVRLERACGEARVAITDEGPGIPPEALPRLFERFYRAEAARHGGMPGLGLGLAICKGLVEAHDGRIGVESARGRGSTFWFALPCA